MRYFAFTFDGITWYLDRYREATRVAEVLTGRGTPYSFDSVQEVPAGDYVSDSAEVLRGII